MNREIKFRAWDGLRITTSGIMFNSSSGILETPIESNMKIMQYTGLQDVNDKSIYEGDIIRSEILSGDVKINEVIFKHGAFRIGLQPLNVQKDIEVIGNIYENSELLKDN